MPLSEKDSFKIVTSIQEIYPNEGGLSRVKELIEKFKSIYSESPAFISRSPGRVNLIGEHIDYSDYSVLPMALSDKDILIAVSVNEESKGSTSTIHLSNTNAKFPKRKIAVDSTKDYFDIDATKHEWSHYFMAGVKGILKHLNLTDLKSMNVLVDGNVPTGAGVSSSSAFVCCSALATCHAYNKIISKTELTNICIVSERFVGVQSGGMDQSASVFGVKNSALMIHFYPSLNVETVPLPKSSEEIVFVVAHTLVTADKHVTAPIHYNLRVIETRLASLVFSKKYLNKEMLTLRKFQEAYAGEKGLLKDLSDEDRVMKGLEEMLQLTESLKHDGYTLNEIAELLGLNEKELHEKYMKSFPVKADVFHLYKRSKHVFSEALRVYKFKKSASENKSYKDLGNLMNESQESCNLLFDCSCNELNELTDLARKHGAYGSRLTGAGWGGCTISLVPKAKLASFTEAIQNEYYKKKGEEPLMFSNVPGNGSLICDLKSK